MKCCQCADLGFAKSISKPFFSQMKSTGGMPSAWHINSAVLVPSPLLATFLHWTPFCSSGLTMQEETSVQQTGHSGGTTDSRVCMFQSSLKRKLTLHHQLHACRGWGSYTVISRALVKTSVSASHIVDGQKARFIFLSVFFCLHLRFSLQKTEWVQNEHRTAAIPQRSEGGAELEAGRLQRKV